MNFIDVCFKSKAVGTVDTYNCETTLYGISDEYDEINIATFVFGQNGLLIEKYNKDIDSKELQDINEILQGKYHDNIIVKTKRKMNCENRNI